MTTPLPPASEPALLEVRDLCVHFPITRGTVFRRTVGHVHAVDGITLGLGALCLVCGLALIALDRARTSKRRRATIGLIVFAVAMLELLTYAGSPIVYPPGYERISHQEIADIIGEETGHDVRYDYITQ